jgi:hypothetical protein
MIRRDCRQQCSTALSAGAHREDGISSQLCGDIIIPPTVREEGTGKDKERIAEVAPVLDRLLDAGFRISVGRANAEDQIGEAAQRIADAAEQLRAFALCPPIIHRAHVVLAERGGHPRRRARDRPAPARERRDGTG